MAGFAAARWYLAPENHLTWPLHRHVSDHLPCSKQSRFFRRVLSILPPSPLTATAHLPPLAQPTAPSSPWVSLRHRFRGRDAGCPAPPAQIRTCALTHTAPTFGSDRDPRGDAVSVRPPVSRFLGSVSDPCFGLADSRRSPALAPATPQRPITALLAAFIATMPVSDFFAPYIIGLRHHAFPMRSHRLPDRTTEDLPGPGAGCTCVHGVSDAAKSGCASPWRRTRYCLRP